MTRQEKEIIVCGKVVHLTCTACEKNMHCKNKKCKYYWQQLRLIKIRNSGNSFYDKEFKLEKKQANKSAQSRYYEKNREQINARRREYDKVYREMHREEISKKQAERYRLKKAAIQDKELDAIKQKQHEYYLQHKEHITQRRRLYEQQNREQVNARTREKRKKRLAKMTPEELQAWKEKERQKNAYYYSKRKEKKRGTNE